MLADIDQRGITRIVCLGDIVGYGPDPLACLDLVMQRCIWSLMGNHDYAVLYEPTNFNAGAAASAYWTRGRLEAEQDEEKRKKRWEYVGNLKVRETDGQLLFVHGSPRRPINEYIFADDVTTAPVKMEQIFERVKQAAMVGHTHVQGAFTDEPDFYEPDELGWKYPFNDHEKAVINVGSVGQPRDRDPRSGYAILHEDRVQFVRLEYDMRPTIEKIEQIPELENFFGQRLLDGR